jgi:hypothetical protein
MKVPLAFRSETPNQRYYLNLHGEHEDHGCAAVPIIWGDRAGQKHKGIATSEGQNYHRHALEGTGNRGGSET